MEPPARWAVGVLVLSAVGASGRAGSPAAATRPAVGITVSRQTTFLTGPLNADGTVNYSRALDDICGKGVTRQNNAAIDFVRILGPKFLEEKHRRQRLAALGLPPDLPDPNVSLSLPEPLREWFAALPTGADLARPPAGAVQWCRSKAAVLDALAAAAKKEHLFVPAAAATDSPPLSEDIVRIAYRELMAAQRALLVRAVVRAVDGDPNGASGDLLAAYRIARLVSRGPFLTDCLLAHGVEGLASGQVLALVKAGLASPQFARGQLEAPSKLPPLNGPEHCVLGERLLALDFATAIVRDGPDKATRMFATDPNEPPLPRMELDADELLRLENAEADRQASCYAKGRFSLQVDAFRRSAPVLSPLAKRICREVPGLLDMRRRLRLLAREGKSLTAKERARALHELLGAPDTAATILSLTTRTRAMQRLSQVALALVVYRDRHRQYPRELGQLAPAILAAVPTDPFTDGQFVYKASSNGYTLYSLGPNMRDDNGQGACGGAGKDDIAVEMKQQRAGVTPPAPRGSAGPAGSRRRGPA